MSTLTLTPTKMRRGVWEGIITNAHPGQPQLSVTHLNKEEDLWLLQVPIPEEAIADGEALGDDMRVEIELPRAEIDMLKRAFRRHCVETS
ncbi:hypothetical protein N9777_04760 [Ascidiaceihabitans sp.]|nr:hypothetical protein [Ascidiaceihabitans sp.]